MNDEVHVELRGPCPKYIVDVLDAVALANEDSRMSVVNQVLGKWAREKLHEATLIARVMRGNGSAVEGDDRGAERGTR